MTMKPATPSILSFLFVLINIVPPVFSQVPPGSPSITGPDVIVRGENIVLSCSSTGGSPAPTVKWFRDDQEITTGVSSSTSGSTVTTTYTFIATLNEHYEVFECQAENGVLQNPLKTTKFVYVHYTPDPPVFNGPTDLVAGNPGTWTCTSSNGYPAGTMTIKNTNTGVTFTSPEYSFVSTPVNGGRSFTVTGTLNWSPALSNNGNQLCCEVAHPTTISTPQSVCKTLNVREQLAINAPIKSYTPTIGTSVTLQCVVTSGNPTIISWYKGNTQLNPATDSRYTNGNVNTPSLTINSVVQSDAGDYTCRANDGFVSVNTDNINVNPQGTPPVVTIPVNSYTQTVGNSITMVCQVSSPNSALQRVQWIFTNQNNAVTDPIDTSTAKYTGSTTTNPSLTVNNVQFSDEGTYRCRATNLIGTTLSVETTYLDVQGTIPVLNIPQDTYTAVYGQQLVIDCTIQSANPSVTNIYWTRQSGGNTVTINNGDGGYQGSTPQTPALTINFVTTAHTGTYRCHGTNVVGTGSSNQAAVTITGGLLTINQSPSSANVLQGSATTIQCIVSGTPTATSITWLFTPNGGTQGVLNKVVSKHTGGTTNNPSLTINNFQSTDAGIYTCQAQNAAGTTTSSTSTTLTFMQQLQLTISPADGTAIVGDNTYSINCQITGIPSPTSTSWFKRPTNGGQQTTITAGNKYTITANTNNPVLVINNIAETDEADYFCTATNLAGTVTSSRARLVVNGGLNTIAISPQSDNVIQGTNKLITCTVTGQPSPTQIRWYFTSSGSNSRQQLFISTSNGKYTGGTPSNPSMTVNNFQSGDAGSYQCEATNAAGTVTSGNSVLSYLGILSVTIQPSSQQATIGDASVTIQCTIQGTPQATSWEWTKTVSGGNPVVISQGTNNGKLQVANSATNPNLVIFNVVSDDAAEYRCRANNGAGLITSSPSTLTVQGTLPSINVEPSQYTATVGDDSFQFQCFVSAVPQASSWYWTFQPSGGGAAVTISQGTNNLQYMVDNSPSNPHLTIREIALNEAGQYFCHAANAVGSRQSTAATLLVTGGILNVNISPASANVVRGNSQQILCIISGTPTAEQIKWFFTAAGSSEQQLSITSSNGKYSGGTVGTPHLTISNFQNSDAGSYRCEAVNAAGTGTSPSSVLTYVENLSISTSPSDGTAIYGDASYTIQCTITGTPEATTWSWTRRPLNGGTSTATTITEGTKYSIANSATGPHLTIKNIVEDDERDYYCHATNVAGSATSTTRARLIVNGGLLTVSISPPSANVLKGQSQQIQCTVSGIPSATNIIWYFTPTGGNQEQTLSLTPAKYTGGTTTTPSLTINSFQASDAGTYVCAAVNPVGTARSSTSTLTFMEQLTITVSPADGTAVYGDSSYTIQCTITGVPAATGYSWYRRPINSNADLSQISHGTKYSIVSSFSAPHLTINNIVEEDEQDYFCRATNIAGTQLSTRARLVVNGGLLTIQISPQSANVQIGTTQQITCTITGEPAATIVSWRFTPSTGGAPQTVDVTNSNGKYTGGNLNTPHLTITNFQSTDSGSYVCSATNAVGQRSSTPSVLTFVQPLSITVSPADSTRVYGTASYEIDCIISGSPEATSWSWSSRPIDGAVDTAVNIVAGSKYSIASSRTRPKLTIFNIVEADEKDYYCHATNVVGEQISSRARLIVSGDLLTVSISPETANVIRGNTQTINCQVTGNPIVQTISWTKDGATIDISGNPTKYSGATPGNPSLTVIDFQQGDAGVYVCTATNAVGSKSSTTSTLSYIENLNLQVNPAEGQAVLGAATFVFQCQITGSPQATTWRWIKNPGQNNAETIQKGTNSQKYSVLESATNPQLTIKNIAQSDDAFYRCEATNAAGTRQSASARLIVTGQLPAISVNPLQQFPQYGASSVTISCTVTASPSADTVGWRKITVDSSSTTNIDAPNSNGKYSVANSVTNPDLTINNVVFTDDANYQCYATNAVGTGNSALARVDVQGSRPQVTIPSSSFTAVYGNDITIPCQITGANPGVTAVTWYKVNNQQVSTINIGDPASYSGGTVATPALTIRNVNNADGGFYRCTATNQVGTGQSSDAQLLIQGGIPTVTLSKTTESVVFGETVTFICTISSQLPAVTRVFWQFTRNSQTTQIDVSTSQGKYTGSTVSDPSLTVHNAAFTDEGSYQCFAENVVGIGQSDALVLGISGDIPVVTLSRSFDTVLYGTSSVTINCLISSPYYPILRVIWQKTSNGVTTQIIVENSGGKYGGSTVNSPGLTIYNAEYTDSGSYICIASNVLGNGQSPTAYQLSVVASLLTVTVPKSTYTVLIDNTVSLQCSVTGLPSATEVYWEKRGINNNFIRVDPTSNNRYSGGNLNNPTLAISSSKFEDEGVYRCVGVNAAGRAESIETTLDVTGTKPTVTIGSPTYSVDYGQSITLVCTVTSNPMYTTVSWTKTVGSTTKNVDLTNTAKYSGSKVGNPSLTISSANLNDKGTYICSATNSVGTGSSSGTLLNVVGGLLNVMVTQPSYNVQLGGTVTLGCTWSGVPSADFITWQKVVNNVATDINVGTSNGKYVGATVSGPSLSITSASNDDKADYICTATNAAGRASSQKTTLDVMGSAPQVRILKDTYTVNYGNAITLECIVSAVPTHHTIKWKVTKGGTTSDIDVANSQGKYGGATVNSPSLVINNANLNDEASYICTATNQIGSGTSSSTLLDVIGGVLTVTIPPDPYSAQVGKTITIPCIINGSPAPNQVKWRKIQNAVPTDIDVTNGGGKYSGSSTGTPALTINNVLNSDSAYYQCTATNVEGISSSNQVFLSVTGNIPVVEIPADTYTVNYGASTTIPCTVVQSVPSHKSVQWKRFRNGNLEVINIQGSNGKYSGGTVSSPSLTISNAVQDDETSYICTATNDVGTGQSFARFLDVIGGLLTVTIPSSQYTVQAGGNVELVCMVNGSPSATSILWKKIPLDGNMAQAQDINVASSNGKYSGASTSKPSLTIHNAADGDKAKYLCTATNNVGSSQSQQTTLNVIGTIPSVVILNPPYSVTYGQTVTIQCQVTATPAANTVLWKKTINGVETTINVANSNGKYSGGSVTTPSLTIANANIQDDEGNYVCSGTNSLGTGRSASVYLDVIGGLLTVNAPTTLYSVQQGNSLQLICTWSGTPGATAVSWKKYVQGTPSDINVANSNGKYSGSTVASPSLTINNVNQNDVATYVCSATNAEGTSNSQPINLQVTGGLPVVKIKKPVYTVNHGNFVILECTVAANPDATSVQWYKIVNGNSVTLDVPNVSKYSGATVANPSLTITGATAVDEGNYICSATNSLGTSQSSQTFLDVFGDILTVVIPQDQYKFDVGTDATLECRVTGSPTATKVYWTKSQAGGASQTINMTDTNKYSGSSLTSPSLVIHNAQSSDDGTYRCWATNAVGTAQSSPTKVTISGSVPTVTLTSTKFPVIVGNEIVLGCNVISNPAHTNVYWIFTNSAGQTTTITSSTNTVKYGGVTLQSPSLILRNADFSDIGKYVCYATNSIGTGNSGEATLEVSGQPPTVNVPVPNNNVDFGNSVTLTCTVTANPPHTIVYWRKLRNGITTNINVAQSGGKYAGSTVSNPSLQINNAQLDDQGSYTCYAQNSVGTGQSTPTALLVTGNIPYVRIEQSQYTVDYGKSVTLGCVVTANPAHSKVYWQKIKNNQVTTIDAAAIANNARYSGSTTGSPSLTISNVNLDDAASYICFAENSVGVGQSSQTRVVISGSAPQVAILSNNYRVEVGNTITIQCVITANPSVTSVQWQRLVNGQTQNVDVAGNARITGGTVTTPSITINNAQFSDEGNYICTATNAVGTGASAQSYLDVFGNVPSVAVPQTQFEFNYGQTATLQCTVTANPTETKVYWKKLLPNGQLQEVDLTSSKYSGSIVGSPNLIISQVNKDDQAFYQCFADNNVGTGSSAQTFLRVQGDIPVVSVPPTHSFTLGTTAVLQCTVNANPPHTNVYWAKYNAQNQLVNIDMGTNNNNKYQGATQSSPSLTILNTVAADAGRYVCYGVNIVGTGQSGTTTLDITGAVPVVSIPQDQYTIGINNQITLACTVSASPAETSVYWTKQVGNANEVTIDKTNTAKYQGQTVNSPSLIILNADFSDNARFYCFATNDIGTGKSNPTTLTVTGTVPNVQIPLNTYSVNYAQTATIPCTVNAAPSATSVQWKKIVNGVEQNVDLSSSKYSGSTTQSPALIISNAVTSDEAFYICTASNSVGTGRSSQTYLDVLGAAPIVNIGANTYSVQKNKNVELVCTINANPQAQSVQWYRFNGGVQTALRSVSGKYNSPTVSSPNLMINNADDQDRGYYICTATNIVGTGTSTSTFLDVTGNIPVVAIALNQYNGNFGGTVTLGCTVVANPQATEVYWVKSSGNSNTEIRTSTNKYSFSLNSPSLTINNLQQSDEANYKCYAVNSIGTGSSQNTFLDMVGSVPQVSVSAQSVDINIGGSATIVCNIQANPTHTNVYWKKLDGTNNPITISIDNSKYVGGSVNNPSLTVNNAQLSDRANYVCFASNDVGLGQSGQAYLNVIGNPPVVNIASSSYTVPWGNEVTIVCTITANPTYTGVSWKKIQNGVETVIDVTNSNKYEGGVVGSPSLKIKQANRNTDQAFYECSATNSVGTGTSSRTFVTVSGNIPAVAIPNNYQVEIGQSVIVVCTVNSDPAHTTVQWQRRSASGSVTNLDISNQNKYQNGNLNNPSLTILSATAADEGYYICTATNAVGTGTSGDRYVDVTGNILQVSVPQDIYNVNYGQTIQLVCTVTGSPAATEVYWVRVRQGQSTEIKASTMDTNKYSGVTLNNPSLTVLNANENDGGVYKCYAKNIVGVGQSQQTQLNVIGSRPTVTIGSDSYSVNLGNSVTLQCTVIATPSAQSVRWNKIDSNGNSNPIDVAGNPTKYTGGSLSIPSLTVYNAQSTDGSSYTCQATNAVGTTVSSQTTLTVVGNKPVVKIGQSQYSVTVGDNALLECTVESNPLHTAVFWRKIVNGQPVELPSNSRYGTPNLGNPSLSISGVLATDIGNYKCYATNSVGTGESAQTYLNVIGSKPVVNVASIQYSVNIGNSITLQCNVQSNPLHTNVKWQKIDGNGNAVDVDMTNNRYTGSKVNSPSLIISNTISGDQGGYICLATNIVGTGQSRQTFLTVVGSIPTVTVPTPTYSVNTGSTITLECSYSANPQATQVRWEKTVSGNTVDIGDTTTNNKYGGSTLGSPSLIIYNAAESDEGSYRCKVSNAVGTGISSTSTTLDVIGNVPIVTVPTGAYTVNVGESKTLTCEVTSDPAHTNVYWQKVSGGQTITIDTNLAKYGGSTISSPSLVINNAAFSDSGTYYCFATNAVGTGQSTQVVLAVAGTTPSVSLTNTNVQANYGNSVTLGCVVSANPAATSVYWQKIVGNQSPITIDTSNTAKYSGGTVGNPSLQISNVNTNDEASYICFAANSVGTGQSERGTLNVIGSPPVVTIPEASYTINIGNTITIACSIQSNPAHNSVYWTRKIGNNQEEQISTTGSASSKYSGSTVQSPSLVIYNVQMSDAGQYNCHATNIVGTGKANTPTNLRVVGNVPTVTASIPSSVRIGTSITIDCSVDANPAATQIIWQFVTNNAASNIDISGNSRFSGGSVANPDLTISPVQESDEGTYRCQAVNSEGTGTSNTVYLDATGDPPINVVINPSPLTVEEGQTISTTCSAQGTPAPSYEWRKFGSNTVIASGATLSIANAKESDATSYTCTASNSFGSNTASVNVDVQYRPKVQITNHPITGKLAQSVTIQCAFTSNPFANKVQWKKVVGGVNTNINIDGNKYQGGTLTSPSLTIFNLGASDQGDYICTVTNSVGTGNSNTGSLTVDMRTSPMGIQIFPGQITVLEGNDFSIYCNATANPSPSYEWYHKDVKVGTGQTLTIKNSEWTPHDGLYTCKAENEIGYQEATIDVDVKYTPVNAVAENTFTPALNSPITLTCNTKANPSAIAWKWFQNGYEIVGQTEKTLSIDMDSIQDVGQYHCVAYNEVGHSPNILFTVSLPVSTSSTTTTVGPNTGAAVASAGGLTGGEIAAICLGILFFVLLLIVLIACCVLQGCCAWCCGAGAAEKDRRITPDPKVSIPQFYEVPTVVTREPSLISKRDVSLHMAPVYSGRPSNEYEITKYRVIRPEYEVRPQNEYVTQYRVVEPEYTVGERYVTTAASPLDERYLTTASRPYYLPPIEYTYDEEERRRRHKKKKRSRRHEDVRGDEQIVLEERVVGGNTFRSTRSGAEDVTLGPELYFEAEN